MSRLKFELKKIRIEPLVHLRMLRHANEHYLEEPTGQLWGILYDQIAEVTNILPIIESDDREENDASERRYEENLPKFNMDSEKLGWYCIEHKKNFWSGIEFCRLYEDYIKTSFYLVFDYNVSQMGGNPYRAYRLKDKFASKQNFSWRDLAGFDFEKSNPFDEIPVEIIRNPLVEALLEFNKKNIFDSFRAAEKSNPQTSSKQIQNDLKHYSTNIEDRTANLKSLNELYLKNKQDSTNDKKPLLDRPIEFQTYSGFLSGNLVVSSYQQEFKKKQHNLEGAHQLLNSIIE